LIVFSRWLIKLGFHLLYYQMAWTYDIVAWSVSFKSMGHLRRGWFCFLHPGPTLTLAPALSLWI
jgi:hypothetical protein